MSSKPGSTQAKTASLGNLIAGAFRPVSDPSGEWRGVSPGDLSLALIDVRYSYKSIDEAISAAREAHVAWERLPQSERTACIERVVTQLEVRAEELAPLLALESGVPISEAKREIAHVRKRFSALVAQALPLVSAVESKGEAQGQRLRFRYRSQGVLAVITPFSMPIRVAMEQLMPALLTGNTVVWKPSEKVAAVSQELARCFESAGLPAGVFNMLQGEKELGRRLSIHEGVDGILFCGSYEIGTRIRQDILSQHWKRLSLNMGGKNPMIVCADADFDRALADSLSAVYLNAGQRCTSASRVLVHKSKVDLFTEKFHEASKKFSVGNVLEDPFMGPLIDAQAMDRFMKFIAIASREGAELVMRGKMLELTPKGHYVVPTVCRLDVAPEQVKKSVYLQTEILGPSVAISAFDSNEEAIALANATSFGLVASVYTHSHAAFGEFSERLQFGSIHLNCPTTEVADALPFGGMKKSGNHAAGALHSVLNCTRPVASIESAAKSGEVI